MGGKESEEMIVNSQEKRITSEKSWQKYQCFQSHMIRTKKIQQSKNRRLPFCAYFKPYLIPTEFLTTFEI